MKSVTTEKESGGLRPPLSEVRDLDPPERINSRIPETKDFKTDDNTLYPRVHLKLRAINWWKLMSLYLAILGASVCFLWWELKSLPDALRVGAVTSTLKTMIVEFHYWLFERWGNK